jgi:DNA-binding Lrp family transcriptional regulator
MGAFDEFRLLLDEYSSEILELTGSEPLNATELSDALGIPIAACYRRIRTLKNAGLLREEGRTVSIGGKLVATYRNAVDRAEVMLQDGRLKVVIKANGEDKEDEMSLGDGPTMLHWQSAADRPRPARQI